MITTADLIDICSLYFTQSAAQVRRIRVPAWSWYQTTPEMETAKMHGFRCSMYALSARLILEGVY